MRSVLTVSPVICIINPRIFNEKSTKRSVLYPVFSILFEASCGGYQARGLCRATHEMPCSMLGTGTVGDSMALIFQLTTRPTAPSSSGLSAILVFRGKNPHSRQVPGLVKQYQASVTIYETPPPLPLYPPSKLAKNLVNKKLGQMITY